MGLSPTFGMSYAKSQVAAHGSLPTSGTVFVSVANRDKRNVIFPIKRLADLGFTILATEGTASMLSLHGVDARPVRKHSEGRGPNGEPTIVELITQGRIGLILNTPSGETVGGSPRRDGYRIRTASVLHRVPSITTVQGLEAAVQGIEAVQLDQVDVRSLQEWAQDIRAAQEAGIASTGGSSRQNEGHGFDLQ